MHHVAKFATGVAAVLLLAGCTQQAATTNTSSTSSTSSSSSTSTASASVVLSEYKFEPSTLTLKVGQAVQLQIKNTGTISHTYTVPELGINQVVAPGGSTSVNVTPDTAGTFEATCTMPGHAGLGMKGSVVVQ